MYCFKCAFCNAPACRFCWNPPLFSKYHWTHTICKTPIGWCIRKSPAFQGLQGPQCSRETSQPWHQTADQGCSLYSTAEPWTQRAEGLFEKDNRSSTSRVAGRGYGGPCSRTEKRAVTGVEMNSRTNDAKGEALSPPRGISALSPFFIKPWITAGTSRWTQTEIRLFWSFYKNPLK